MKEMIKSQGTYRFSCIGPKKEFEDEYLYLRDIVLPNISDSQQAERLKIEMDAMLEHKWDAEITNMVPGANFILDTLFNGSAYTAAWYIGLISLTSYTALSLDDTAASHAGWIEDTNYTESNRPTLTFDNAASRSITLTSSVSFSANASSTIKGAFVITDNTKSGTTGNLLSEGLFVTGDKVIENGYILNASFTMNIA